MNALLLAALAALAAGQVLLLLRAKSRPEAAVAASLWFLAWVIAAAMAAGWSPERPLALWEALFGRLSRWLQSF